MLRHIRKYSRSTGVKILYAVLALTFVAFLGGVGGMGAGGDVVAKVHGEPITRSDLDFATANLRREYENVFQGRFGGDLARSLNLPAQALDRLIDQALIAHEAARLGIDVTDDDLLAAVRRIPALQENGRFSRARLEAFLQTRRDGGGEFETELRQSLLTQQVQALVTDGVQVSDAEVEELYRLDHEKVSVAFVRITAEAEAKDVTLDDEALQRYLDAHGNAYLAPEEVRVRYAAYRPTDYLAGIQPTDGEIAEHYELYKDEEFTEPEQVHARHILVSVPADADAEAKEAARRKAEDLLGQVEAGGDFAALATAHSDDPVSAEKGGDLGFFGRGRMTPAFEAAAFALEAGQVSPVVETPFGFHIIEVEEHRAPGPKPLEEVRDQVVEVLRNQRAVELARAAADAVRAEVVEGKTLAEAVGDHALVETEPFAAGASVPGLGDVPDFAAAAFALEEGEVSDLVEGDNDVFYLLEPIERREARVPPLEEIRERVAADAARARGSELATERAEKLRARAAEVGLAAAAGEIGATVERTDPFDRRAATIPKLGPVPNLPTDAFALTAEAPLAPAVYAAGDDAVVVALDERVPADMSGFAAAKDALRDRLLAQKREAVLTAYMDFLKKRAAEEGELEVRADVFGRG